VDKIRVEKLIFLYCILAFINFPKVGYLLDSPAFRLFDWYINDLSVLARVAIVFFPLAFGVSIDAKMYWDTRREYLFNLINRFFFAGLLLMNFITLFADYSQPNDNLDLSIALPKMIITIGLLFLNWNIINKRSEK